MIAYIYNTENNKIVAKINSNDYDAIFNKLCELNCMGLDEYAVSFTSESLVDNVDIEEYNLDEV